eukprot:jgi/Bigna1/87013/estExt_fgenesh1_pg.C_160021
MARSNFAFLALCAVLSVACYFAFLHEPRLQMAPVRARMASRSVATHAAKGALGSWGDLISKNAKGGGMPKKVVTEKTWWNCLDPKWKKGGAGSNSEAQQWINGWKSKVGK